MLHESTLEELTRQDKPKLFSMPDSTCVPSSQSLHVGHCMRVMLAGIAELMVMARSISQTPLLDGKYLPIDQLTDFVSVPLNFAHIAPKAFLPEDLMVGKSLVTADRLNGSLLFTPLLNWSVHSKHSSSQDSER